MALSEDAYERLKTIGEATELGSGFRIAMRDLEIRGAGTLLGTGQSGHIAAVGYDLYVSMVHEAVQELKGEPIREPAEVKLDLPLDANLPATYVPKEELRLEAYRRLSEVTSDAEVADIRAEWEDRYGPVPDEAARLLDVARLRAEAHRLGVREINVTKGPAFGGPAWTARVSPLRLKASQQVRLTRLFKGAVYKENVEQLMLPIPRTPDLAGTLVDLLRSLIPRPTRPLEADALPVGAVEHGPQRGAVDDRVVEVGRLDRLAEEDRPLGDSAHDNAVAHGRVGDVPAEVTGCLPRLLGVRIRQVGGAHEVRQAGNAEIGGDVLEEQVEVRHPPEVDLGRRHASHLPIQDGDDLELVEHHVADPGIAPRQRIGQAVGREVGTQPCEALVEERRAHVAHDPLVVALPGREVALERRLARTRVLQRRQVVGLGRDPVDAGEGPDRRALQLGSLGRRGGVDPVVAEGVGHHVAGDLAIGATHDEEGAPTMEPSPSYQRGSGTGTSVASPTSAMTSNCIARS